MFDFLKRHQVVLTSLVFCLLSVQLVTYHVRGSQGGTQAREIIYFFTSPIQQSIHFIKNSVGSTFDDYLLLVGTREENKKLLSKIDFLNNENNRLKEGLALSARLKEILVYEEASPFETVTARVIGSSGGELSGSWTRTLTVNRGRRDGIEIHMPVIVPRGVVGKIMTIESRTSQVLLITDPRFNIDTVLQKSRTKAMASGDGSETLNIKYIRQVDQALMGEKIITAGVSGLYPKGLSVGEVVEVSGNKKSFFKTIKAVPEVRTDNLEDVLIITSGSGAGRQRGEESR